MEEKERTKEIYDNFKKDSIIRYDYADDGISISIFCLINFDFFGRTRKKNDQKNFSLSVAVNMWHYPLLSAIIRSNEVIKV